mgnify:CR=1 FL=1
MIKSLFEGVTGLNANALAMGVIGDNIANVKTVGFKAGTLSFAELLGQTLPSGSQGNGVAVWDTGHSWRQGSSAETGNAMDLAIDGEGFFVVQDDDGTPSYTRAGNFQINDAGNLVNPDGLKVLGRKVVDASAGLFGSMEAILVPSGNAPAAATDEISMQLNLDPDAGPDTSFRNALTVYDALGTTTTLDFLFSPVDGAGKEGAAAEWRWEVSVDPSVTDTPVMSSGLLSFDAEGRLDPEACIPAGGVPTITVADLKSGADPLRIEWRYLQEGPAGPVSDGSITGRSGLSEIAGQSQNGYPEGELQRILADEQGILSGVYSNGVTTPLCQIVLAEFASPQGLLDKGNNCFGQSAASGQPAMGAPAAGSMGRIVAGALEQSNVDLNAEFVDLITTQRAFQANSKVITTSDELLAALTTLKG